MLLAPLGIVAAALASPPSLLSESALTPHPRPLSPRGERGALPPLHVEGRYLKDPSGKTVLLKGANLGNWLVIEFWMLALGGKQPKDQYDLEALLASRFGEAEKERLMNVYRESWIMDRDLKILPTFGFNCVRLPMNYRLMEDDAQPFQLKKDAWRWIDRAVSLAERNGLYTILDMHGVQGGQNVNDHTGRSGQNHIKDSPEDQRRLAWLWGEVAKRYRNRPSVVAYDVWNEPYDTPKPLHKPIFEQSLKAIRRVDPDKLVWAMGNYDTFEEYGDPKANGWRNVGFQMHYYPGLFGGGAPTVATHAKHLASLKGVQARLEALNVPFLVGEMNVVFDRAGGADMMRRTYDLHASYGWATTMWSYKVLSREGGIGDAFWGMVANREPAPQVNFYEDPKGKIEAYFRSFATMPLTVNEKLRHALTDPNYVPAPLPPPPVRRTSAPDGALAGWTVTDIGGAIKGGLEGTPGAFSLYGGGRDIWGGRDEFRFLNRVVEGDFELSVTLSGVEDLDQYTKAGLMVREDASPESPFVLLSSFPSGEVQLAHRDFEGGDASAPPTAQGKLPDLRLRLVRRSGSFTAYYGDKLLTTVPDRLPRRVLVGPVASSHDAEGLVKVEYRDLKLIP